MKYSAIVSSDQKKISAPESFFLHKKVSYAHESFLRRQCMNGPKRPGLLPALCIWDLALFL
jgi:hypothetical protein